MTDTQELLPCPFCGSNELTLDKLTDRQSWFVSCDSCDVQQIADYFKQDAVSRWNTRTPDPVAEGLLEALEGLLNAYEKACDWTVDLPPETVEAERVANSAIAKAKARGE